MKISLKKLLIALNALVLFTACTSPINKDPEKLNALIDQWHVDVAESNFDGYFDRMGGSSFFIGTDANERWTKDQFMEFSKPYFDKESTWDFKVIDRNLVIDTDYPVVWFDEVLDTWMGLCRGSGVLKYKQGSWYLEHYVLSLTVPNDDMDAVIEVIQDKEEQLKLYSPASAGK
ncbi:MAG: nuclear transport factor 2 family protein [Flavobacteriaceae bacterium]